jgi:hypothetical protein
MLSSVSLVSRRQTLQHGKEAQTSLVEVSSCTRSVYSMISLPSTVSQLTRNLTPGGRYNMRGTSTNIVVASVYERLGERHAPDAAHTAHCKCGTSDPVRNVGEMFGFHQQAIINRCPG